MTTMTRLLPLDEWNTLALLARADKALNCAVINATVGTDMKRLREFETEQQIIAINQVGREGKTPLWLTSPGQMEARLTEFGKGLGRIVVLQAGVLLLLARRRGAFPIDLVKGATGIDAGDLAALAERNLIEYCNRAGEPVAPRSATHVSVTRRGREYSTEDLGRA